MSDHDNDDDINDENRFSSYRMITMMMFFMKMVRTQNGQKMGNVQATASHDDNTDNNDNYVEDDIDKKIIQAQLYPRNARFLLKASLTVHLVHPFILFYKKGQPYPKNIH